MGIGVFIDNINIPKGQYIAEAIPRAIAESRFSVVVLSKGYASSTWCLDELVSWLRYDRALPVFYHLPPSGVSDLSSGCYKRDLDRHKEKFTYVRVNRWRLALKSIADIAGWVLSDHQYVLVQKFVLFVKTYSIYIYLLFIIKFWRF
ncbi:unnamed protein product [Linum tenue]|uniref:ADP-ribosyl cyclase/cyclic ADP-ribose hydrolase n=1 Tax=Linum tenue TaxID=586396 RepID=A0AAV0R4I7_9ROSI|nr:unnamed protein product [Linum tenue]